MYITLSRLAVFSLLHLFACAAAAGPAERPNVLFILSDDHSSSHLGCYGDKQSTTPNLDRFAEQGMCFEKQFCGAPQCVPSRAVFMTGRSAVAARITRFSSPLPADVPAVPDLLRSAGYYTGICRRSFHLNGPMQMGPIAAAVYEKHPELRSFANRVDYLDVNSPRAKTVERVTEFLDKVPDDKPFFLWVSFNDPHHPWDRDAIAHPHDPAAISVPAYLPDIPEVRNDLARYYDEVTRMDEEFQWVMDILEKRSLTTNTLVMFLGDNGYAFPHGKGSLYDPGLNTPLLVRWPGKVKPATRNSDLISGEDIAPTILEAAGVALPKGVTGNSFLKVLLGQEHESRKYIFAERGPHGSAPFNENSRADTFDLSRCVRSNKYKYIYNCTPHQAYKPVDSGNDSYWKRIVALHEQGQLAPQFERMFAVPRPVHELYDLANDPAELNNLAGKPELQEVENELKAALQEKMILDYDFLPLPLQEKGKGRAKQRNQGAEVNSE